MHPHDYFACPTPDCPNIVYLNEEDKNTDCTEFICQKCSVALCWSCKVAYHYGITCEKYKHENSVEIIETLKNPWYKLCP